MLQKLSALLALCSLTVASQRALAEPGSSAPLQVSVGFATHPAPTQGLNARRDGHSALRLPKHLKLRWRAQVPFGLLPGAAVAQGGHLLAATPSGELVELDAQGKSRWTKTLRERSSSSVHVLANGTRVVATRGGGLQGFDEHGSERFNVRPGWTRPDESVAIVPLPEGSFVLGSGQELVWLESDGTLRASSALEHGVAELYGATGGVVVAVSKSGEASAWSGSTAPTALGDFGSPLRSLPLLHGNQLLTLTDRGLRSKDVRSGVSATLFSSLEGDYFTAIGALADGSVVWLGADNTWERIAAGQLQRVPLGPPPTAVAALQPLTDAQGNSAFVTALGEVALLNAAGQITLDTETRCARPLGLLPLASERIVLVCGSGSVWAFGS
jgi:hypothetical protein